MEPADAHDVATVIDDARRARRALDAGAVVVGDLASAYAVQHALTAVRLARGDRVVGWKLGYTTAVMRAQMGIDAPNYGPLLASMRVDGDALPGTLLQPRVEPEIALVLATDPGRGASPDRVLASCARACLALEIVDSVWTDYRFDLEHNTADGSSAACFVLGDDLPSGAGDVSVALHLEAPDGRGRSSRSTVEGHGSLTAAAEGVAWLAARLAEEGAALRTGDVVLTGGLTTAVPIPAGSRVSCRATTGNGGSATVQVLG